LKISFNDEFLEKIFEKIIINLAELFSYDLYTTNCQVFRAYFLNFW